eukprot:TRINITY_DN19054_c0_g1_i1.p1 TRINITY_DN19054_c0_g1~~TRINITY_DN19054_c0_g1_i1.p1  ORF type:complete len:331 (+),score=50.05 TRINITY_DN19054_c0_g1_i1:66-995(+)
MPAPHSSPNSSKASKAGWGNGKFMPEDVSPASTRVPDTPMAHTLSSVSSATALSPVHTEPSAVHAEPSANTPTLARSVSSPVAKRKKRSPFNVQPFKVPAGPFVDVGNPEVDTKGYPVIHASVPEHPGAWDDRHQLHLWGGAGSKADDQRPANDFLPRGTRNVFSKQESMMQLKDHLSTMHDSQGFPSGQGLLKTLSLPEISMPVSRISADASPTMMPEKHFFGGSMLDRDGKVRLWNDRWQLSVADMNEHLHRSHREYFVQKSLYEGAPSQRWRRLDDQQVDYGVWRSANVKKKAMFGPFGGPLFGRL